MLFFLQGIVEVLLFPVEVWSCGCCASVLEVEESWVLGFGEVQIILWQVSCRGVGPVAEVRDPGGGCFLGLIAARSSILWQVCCPVEAVVLWLERVVLEVDVSCVQTSARSKILWQVC